MPHVEGDIEPYSTRFGFDVDELDQKVQVVDCKLASKGCSNCLQ